MTSTTNNILLSRNAPSVIKTGLTYGLVLGFISIAISLLIIVVGLNPYAGNWWQIVINLVVMVTIVVLAQKNFKNFGNGCMTYGQGFGIAFTTGMLAGIIGITFNLIYTSFIDPDIMLPVWEQSRQQLEAQQLSDQQIETTLAISKKIVWIAGFFTVAFSAAIIALVVTIFTQKRDMKEV